MNNLCKQIHKWFLNFFDLRTSRKKREPPLVKTTSKEQGKHTQQKIIQWQKLVNIMMYLSLSGLNQMTHTNITQILTKEISQKKKAEKMKGRSLVHYKWSVFLPLVLNLSVWCHNMTTEYAASLTVSGRGRKSLQVWYLAWLSINFYFFKCHSLAHKLCPGYSFTKVCHYSTNLHFPHYHYQIHITSSKKSCRNNAQYHCLELVMDNKAQLTFFAFLL